MIENHSLSGSETTDLPAATAENTSIGAVPSSFIQNFGFLKITIALIFFLLFAYDVWEVIESTLEFNQHLNLQAEHWALLVLLMVLPVALWALCVLVGRKLAAAKFVMVMLVGWAVSAMMFLSLNFVLQLSFVGIL